MESVVSVLKKPIFSRTHSYKKIVVFANFLLLFSVIMDPTNVLFKIKDISFLFFVVVAFPYVKYEKAYIPLIFVTIYFICATQALLTNQYIDNSRFFAALKSFVFLSYILFLEYNVFLKTYKILCLLIRVMSWIIIILYIIFSMYPNLATACYLFVSSRDQFIMISSRTFIGLKVQAVYYRTSPVIVLPLVTSLVGLFKYRNLKNLYSSLLLFIALLCTGSRANMLSALLILGFIFLFHLFYRRKAILAFMTLLLIFMAVAFILIFMLLHDTGEHSLDTKALHQVSYWQLFDSHPFRFAFLGGGPARMFYTLGWKRYVSITELSYYDLVKDFGLLWTIVILLLLFIPFLQYYNNRKIDKFTKASLSLGYVCYLFIAGTNPLLVSSTGFIVYAIEMYISSKSLEELELVPRIKNRNVKCLN